MKMSKYLIFIYFYFHSVKLKILLLQPGQLTTELLVWMLLRTVLRLSDWPPRMEQSGLSLMSVLVLT